MNWTQEKAGREKIAALTDEAKQIHGKASTENRSFTDVESKRFDDIKAEVTRVNDSLKRGNEIEDWTRSVPGRDTNTPGNTNRQPIKGQRYGKLRALWDSKDEAYDAGCWLAASFLGHTPSRKHCEAHGIQVLNTMTESSDPDGGALVPEVWENAIRRNVESYGAARANCRNVRMSSDVMNLPRRISGVTAYFVGETVAPTASSPQVKNDKLVAKTLAVQVNLSRQLDQDAIVSMADFVALETALQFALKEDQCLFSGDGTSTYGGIKGLQQMGSASFVTAASGHTAFSSLTLADFESMLGAVPQYATQGDAAWYISRVGYANSIIRLVMASNGNATIDFGKGPELAFLGYPVRICQAANSTSGAQVSTTGLCYFGRMDLAATLGTRLDATTEVLRELYAPQLQIAILTAQRFDIALTEPGDSSTAGPLIGLKTPGS